MKAVLLGVIGAMLGLLPTAMTGVLPIGHAPQLGELRALMVPAPAAPSAGQPPAGRHRSEQPQPDRPLPGPRAQTPQRPDGAGERVVRSSAVSESSLDAARILDYWSPERMREAAPQRSTPAGTSASAGETVTRSVQVSVDPAIGKLFFTVHGRPTMCSGTATRGGAGNVVTTAGHCVYDTAWAQNVLFVPGYAAGRAPYGRWVAEQVYTTSSWSQRRDRSGDIGFARMHSRSGRELTEVVDGKRLRPPDAPDPQRYTVLGYPDDDRFDGSVLRMCRGDGEADPYSDTSAVEIACDMRHGASGGPWLVDGEIASVSSYFYSEYPGELFAPVLDGAGRAAFRSAQQNPAQQSSTP